MRKRISLVLVDDSPSAREGIVALIHAQPGFRVLVGSAKTGAVLRQIRGRKPDLVLLNLLRMGDDSLTLAGAVHGGSPACRVIVMGRNPLHEDVAGFVRAGVSGFLMAKASFDTLLSTVYSVIQGIQVLPCELTRSLFGQLAGDGAGLRRKRALEVGPATTGRLEVAAWSLPSRSFDPHRSPLV